MFSGTLCWADSGSQTQRFSVTEEFYTVFKTDIQALARGYKCYNVTFLLDTKNNHDKITSVQSEVYHVD